MPGCITLFLAMCVTSPSSDNPPKNGEVELSIHKVESEQAAGCPIVLEVKITNVGKEKIAWWCGGPARYPGAEHFVVQTRYRANNRWQYTDSTNGQYQSGSGLFVTLLPGESVSVPLAILMKKEAVDDKVEIRIDSRKWNVAKPAETSVLVREDKSTLDRYRARLIAAAIQPEYSFAQHLVARYADKVVIATLIRMLDLDNEAIVTGISRVLGDQAELPVAAGELLAKAVRHWVPQEQVHAGSGGLREDLLRAALRTQSEAARVAVLELLSSSAVHSRVLVSHALCVSPGDAAWLRRVRVALLAAEKESQKDAELAKRIASDIKSLEARIKNEQP